MPVKLQDWLFAWEIVASYSTPYTVCSLERVCRDIRGLLEASSTGTRLMQRYWNAQYHRLLWDEEHIDASRRTLQFTLSRSDGKKSWKKAYRDEFPLWVARTFRGAGANNNAINVAKTSFKVERANKVLSGGELAKLELTPKEALARQVGRKLLSVEGEVRASHSNGKKGGPVGGRSSQRKIPEAGLIREDYSNDRRLAKHKGKHKKGGMSRGKGYLKLQEEEEL